MTTNQYSYKELSKNIFDCKVCPTPCDGVSKMNYNFMSDVEFAEKNEEIQTNNKKGKVILVSEIVKSSLSEFSVKPGAIIYTKEGMKTSIIKTIKSKKNKSKLKILFANNSDLFFPRTSSEE